MSTSLVQYCGVYAYYHNWLFIEADPEINRYYRTLYSASKFKCDKLQRTQKDSHITVISRYSAKPPEFYAKKYDGQTVEFNVDVTNAFDDGTYVWFPVFCLHAQDLRSELGLGEPHWPFHLTIGNRKRNTAEGRSL